MIRALPFSIPIFFIAALAFALFSLIYLVITASIIYHLRMFSIPGRATPYITSTVFTVVSSLLWLAALFFLFKLPQ